MVVVYLILTKRLYGNKSPIVWFFRFFRFSYSTTINVKKILAVIDATYAVAKRKPEPEPEPRFFQAFFSQLHKLR